MTADATLTEGTSLRDRVQALRLPQRVDGRGGTTRGGWLPWTLTLLLALSTASLAARVYTAPAPANDSSITAANAQTAAAPAPSPTSASASTEDPSKKMSPTGSVVLESKGYLIAAHQIQVSPIEVSGLVKELYIEEGKRFNKGDVLAVLDRTSFEADVTDARHTLAAAEQRYLELQRGFRQQEKDQVRNELAESEEQLRKMYIDFKRAQDLRGSGSISASDYEQAEMSFRAQEQRVSRLKKSVELMDLGPREERIAAAKSDFEAARARLRKAEWRFDNCTIRAPVSGTILTKKAELGNLVNPLAFAASSGSLCEMADLSDIEVELDITERDISKVSKGMPCKVRVEAYPNRVYEGVVDRLMPIANRAKGALPVRVKVRVPKEEEGVFLKPEMGAVVAFLQG
jgi:multidrug resistance efflux pump